MNTKHLSIAVVCLTLAINFTACKKTDTDNTEPASTEIATTTDLSARAATSDNIAEDNNNVLMEATTNTGVTGFRPIAGERPQTPTILGGGTVTITEGPFPKTITIDFGAGATGPYRITRS